MNHSHHRALVLAGAGAAGNAWQLGLIAGLADRGIDLADAELVVGTSAGSTVAAQITSGVHPADLYAAILAEALPQSRPEGRAGAAYVDWSRQIIDESSSAEQMRRMLAAAALANDPGDDSTRWRSVVASRLPRNEWPERRVLIPALDARTAEPVVFDRSSGIDLVDAVAASTSALTPYGIGDARYLNGGYRRSSNADLAAGCGRVIVLEPFGGRSRTPREWGMDLATQLDELRAGGSQVEAVFPDHRAGDVFNANALDPSTRRPAAIGGYEQGRDLADRLEFWR